MCLSKYSSLVLLSPLPRTFFFVFCFHFYYGWCSKRRRHSRSGTSVTKQIKMHIDQRTLFRCWPGHLLMNFIYHKSHCKRNWQNFTFQLWFITKWFDKIIWLSPSKLTHTYSVFSTSKFYHINAHGRIESNFIFSTKTMLETIFFFFFFRNMLETIFGFTMLETIQVR